MYLIYIICFECFLLPNINSLMTDASSQIKVWPVGTNFQPANSVELISTFTTRTYFICATYCNRNIQCRTFVFDLLSTQCILYEGEVSTGQILTNSSTTQVGSIRYVSNLYNCYNKSMNQCVFDRYVTTMNSSNVGTCPKNTFWNGVMCMNQYYQGVACSSDDMCRNDIGLVCNIFNGSICNKVFSINVVKNGNAEIGPCNRSTGGVSPAYWISTGLLTQLEYNNTDGSVGPSSAGPSDRGNCYFWGGSSAYAYMYQMINLTQYASAIDRYKISYNLSAWLGGWENQDDYSHLWVNFYNSNNAILANVTLPIVYAAERFNISKLIYKESTGMIPANTRYAKIQLDVYSTTFNNDGSADDILLLLTHIL